MDLTERVAALEEAVARLTASRQQESSLDSESGDPDFWFLEGLEERQPDGAVVFAGSVQVPDQGTARWQYGLTTDKVAASDWSAYATSLDALGHPVRLTLLQLVFSGVRSTAELAAQEQLGTTGQLHHHLRVLISAGWLASTGRGHYEIPSTRIVPLLTIVLAARPS